MLTTFLGILFLSWNSKSMSILVISRKYFQPDVLISIYLYFSITGGELFERIANEESVTEKECAYYMRQLLEGLLYMHKMSIVHLDLKVG